MVITIVIAAGIPTAVTGFGFWLIEKKISERDERMKKDAENRDNQRKEYELSQLNMTVATMALAEATAAAVQRIPDAHCNGDMHRALDYANKIKNEQKDFLRRQAINSIDF
ncbi:MAG: serine/threonine protein kinase [Lachnospiraceae bacterium]|nr:serine/threonine protein kinase [Lachnospiraceae bacterium]